MGYKKAPTHHRDEISGLHVSDDIQPGTHGAEDLARRNQSRQDSINAATKADWPANMTSSNPEHSDPTLGNAFSRMSKPSDYVVGSKAPRFGASAEDDTDPSTQGGQPQKTPKAKGVEQPKKRG
jgi:hypothetical protein